MAEDVRLENGTNEPQQNLSFVAVCDLLNEGYKQMQGQQAEEEKKEEYLPKVVKVSGYVAPRFKLEKVDLSIEDI